MREYDPIVGPIVVLLGLAHVVAPGRMLWFNRRISLVASEEDADRVDDRNLLVTRVVGVFFVAVGVYLTL